MVDESGWVSNTGDQLAELKVLVETETSLSDYKFASAVEQNALVYDCEKLKTLISN